MWQAKKIQRLINKHGCDVMLLLDDGLAHTSGFVQPVRHNNKTYLDDCHSEYGVLNDSSYLYIGSADYKPVENKTVIVCNNSSYILVKSEMICIGEEPAYCWGIARRQMPS